MKCPFSYEVVYAVPGPDEYYIESGMSVAEDYVEAVKLLAKEFGNDLMCIKNLRFFDFNTSLIKLPPSIIMSYEAGKYANSERSCDEHGKENINANSQRSEGSCY